MEPHLTLPTLLLLAASLTAQDAPTPEGSVSFEPVSGSIDVDPGTTRLTIRFPIEMDPSAGYSICGGGPSFPKIDKVAWQDDRTLLLDVELEADRRYSMPLNCPGSGLNFRRADGSAWPMTDWTFWTAQVEEADEDRRFENNLAVDLLVDSLEIRYSYRDRVVEDWSAVLDPLRDRFARARDPIAFAMRAAEALSVGQDPHLWLRVDGELIPSFQRSFTPNFDGRAVNRLVPDLRQIAPTVFRGTIGLGDERIDYLLLTSWNREVEESIRTAVTVIGELAPSGRGLILDVRPNGGGDERLAGRVARRFLSGAQVYAHHGLRNPETGAFDDIHERTLYGVPDDELFKGPVCVLMGPQCVSSNEAFLLMMRKAEKATLIGDRSGGSSGNPQPIDLGNGVEAMLPSWRALDGDQKPIEGIGLEPDLTVEFDASRSDGLSDPVLERAIAFLRDR